MKNDVFNNNQTERINKRIGIIIKETITLIITRYTLNDHDNQLSTPYILKEINNNHLDSHEYSMWINNNYVVT